MMVRLKPRYLVFLDELDFECNGGAQPIYGCMDREALNYNEEATAQNGDVIENGSTIMIGDCEYCACDYMVNIDADQEKLLERYVFYSRRKKRKRRRKK